jgi:hypothetical protein
MGFYHNKLSWPSAIRLAAEITSNSIEYIYDPLSKLKNFKTILNPVAINHFLLRNQRRPLVLKQCMRYGQAFKRTGYFHVTLTKK